MSNVVVFAVGRNFYAHQLILGSRNTTIMEHILSTDNNIKGSEPYLAWYVQSYKANVVEEFLRYLYTGRVQNLDTMAKDLLSIAHDVQDLQNFAQKHLC